MIIYHMDSLRCVTRLFLFAFFCTFVVLFFNACRPRLPEGVLGEGKLERVLYDYHMAQSISENTTPDSGDTETYRYELIQAVFRKHGITEEQFEQSMNYYCSDLQRLNKIYKSLERRYEREALAYGQTNVRDVYANLSADGDTANVWGGQSVIVVRTKAGENLQSWQQICDSTWLPGDQLLWRFIPVSFSPSSFRSITADLVVHYDNDSIRGTVRQGTTGQQFEIRVDNPESWTPTSIAGHVYIAVSRDGQEQAVVAATQVMLIRLHQERKVKTNSLAVDSLTVDSINVDSIDEAPQPNDDGRRRSPDEFRRQQTVDQKIDIVKEKPYEQPRQRGKRRMQQQQHIVPQRRRIRR